MAKVSYNPGNSTVTFNDIATLTIGQTQLVTSNATTLAARTTVSGTINGTLDVTFGGNFTLTAGFPTGGTFTSLKVDLNGQTLMSVSDFSMPYGTGALPDFNNLSTILGGDDVLTGSQVNEILNAFQGADVVEGGGGFDIINGNQGNDTVDGGAGNDWVRGGQGDDIVRGGDGNDFVSGDRGSDTVTGGAGADIFHIFSGAGLDVVTDFNRAEGDRVLVTGAYTVSQTGANVTIDLGSGTTMVLLGVQQSSLTGDWIGAF
jgi:Ca2+-binding RTX toxin-like protein